MLACPSSKLPLRELPLAAAREVMTGAPSRPLVGTIRDGGPAPLGETPMVLVRVDDAVAFPIVDGIPLLLWPEGLTAEDHRVTVDLGAARYAEAYAEMAYYGDVATGALTDITGDVQYAALAAVTARRETEPEAGTRAPFPHPAEVWLDATYDCTAQERAYRYLAPDVLGATVVQLGGSGLQALKLLVAGAAEAWLVTPVLDEARFGRRLAQEVGLAARFRPVAGIGEEIPLASGRTDLAVSGGCLHHMEPGEAAGEIRRILVAGGRFGAWDPWRAPLYRVGTALVGKREPDVGCRPLDRARAAAFVRGFGPRVDHRRHGALTRYPLLALHKAGVRLDLRRTLPILRRDDHLARWLPPLRHLQSSVSTCAVKSEAETDDETEDEAAR